MKLSNCVVGTVIEAKRNLIGCNGSSIPKGLQVQIGLLVVQPDDDTPIRIDHECLPDGYAWVNPKHFRKCK